VSFVPSIIRILELLTYGKGFAQCSILLNNEFERVFYKNDFADAATLLNLYMICKFLPSKFLADTNY